jgi:hypothetical protein
MNSEWIFLIVIVIVGSIIFFLAKNNASTFASNVQTYNTAAAIGGSLIKSMLKKNRHKKK